MRIVFGWSLTAIMIVFYATAFALAFFVDESFLSLAFDSGGVASGPLTSGFILPLAIGAAVGVGGVCSVLENAFGIVAMVAMTPLITIQSIGLYSELRSKRLHHLCTAIR